MTFGKKLKELRKKKGLTLKAVADVIGSSKGYLSGIEHGKVNPPSDRFVRRIARLLGIGETEMLRLAYFDKVPREVKSEFRTLAGGGETGRIPLVNTRTSGYPAELGPDGLPPAAGDEHLRLPDLGVGRAFAVTVCGDEMTAPEGTGFRAGDLAVATPEGNVRNGDFVYAILAGDEGPSAALRRISLEGNDVCVLKPLNKNRPMISVPRKSVRGLFRIIARVEYYGEAKAGDGRNRT